MENSLPQRKHPVHIGYIDHFNFPTIILLTLCTRNRIQILANDQAHQVFIQAAKESTHWAVGRYVLMPNHIHLFCSPRQNACSLCDWVKYFKSAFSKSWTKPEDKPIWQRNYWDRQIRPGESYNEKWNYVRLNPVRAKYVNDPNEWPYQGIIHHLGA